AGIFQALLMLFLAKSITALTSLSISAVSTNTPVQGGGAYFLISRSLGPELGGAIGVALFCAQAISVPFYLLGFTEALVRSFPYMAAYFQGIGLTAATGLFIIAWVGAGWAIKTQYVIMAVLGASMVSFLGGAAMHFDAGNFAVNWTANALPSGGSFWVVFAIYFPAVTGIMAGVNMSGDLADPGRSIPRGTLAAVGVGFLVYFIQILLCGGAQVRSELLNTSFETLCRQALFGTGPLVVAGVFAATLSSAIGSLLGAPRVLQAVARDNVLPPLKPFARGAVKGDEPHRALLLTFGITVAVVFWAGSDIEGGAFNTLATVVTMFFLYTYGLVNLAAFVECVAGNPSYRPRFRYCHWLTSLVGAAGCAWAAFLIDAVSAVLAAVILCGLYLFLRRKVLNVRFGDARWGFLYSRLRNNLLTLSRQNAHPKNWRPTILVLTGNPETRLTMTRYALWFGETRGLVILGRILVGDLTNIPHLREAAMSQLSGFLRENDFDALPAVMVSQNIDEGVRALIQGQALGALRPNTVMMGWSSDAVRSASFVNHLNTILLLGRSIILVEDRGLPKAAEKKRIDIWWRGKKNGALMVLLGYLLTLNWEWAGAEIRLIRVIRNEAGREPATEALQSLINAARVEAAACIVVSEKPFQEVLFQYSKDASLVMLGMEVPDSSQALRFQSVTEQTVTGLPTTLFICSSGEADLFQ
ncbi:MAG: hypothetical protein PVH22_14380, partial [Desulfobacteraceae bacterium]